MKQYHNLIKEIRMAIGLLGAGLGAGIVTIGVAIGIGQVFESALKGISANPESASELRTTAIIGAALIEGVALFSAVICFMLTQGA